MIFSPLRGKERNGDEQRERFRGGDGEPDAVDVQPPRQQQDRRDLKHQRPQERNERAVRAVVQPGEERRAENVEAEDEERDGVDAQGVDRHIVQRCIVAHKEVGDRAGKGHGSAGHDEAHEHGDDQALAQEAFELRMVLCAVVVADDRRDGDGIAEEKCLEDEVDVHQNAVGAHAVLLRDGHELHVVENADERAGEIAHHLARAVTAGPPKRTQVKAWPSEPQRRVVLAQEVGERNGRADRLRKGGGERRARKAERKDIDEQEVEHHVRQAREHRHLQPEARLFRRGKEALKAVLQHEERQRDEQDAPVEHAVVDGQLRRADGIGDRSDEHEEDRGEHRAADRQDRDEHREDAVRLLRLPLAEGLGDEGAAAGADHEAEGGERHEHGEDEVERGEGVLAHAVGDKEAVHDAVDRGDDHHDDAGHREAQELLVGKMIGKRDPQGVLPPFCPAFAAVN